ncbi:hypothetical protein A0O34_15995 [Chryseobacterium glaciei]|uniref:Uncharacterized protein n=1 Tax=Chryseobacterium glaciei TaxID=1685010 RepID=A0A172XYF5_9FLAO|nr:hypothetical protein A0O34_15995 [Chryseobacterium glaciei]
MLLARQTFVETFNVEIKDYNPSPDWRDILFGCGRSKAEAVTKKIQQKAGNCSLKKLITIRHSQKASNK